MVICLHHAAKVRCKENADGRILTSGNGRVKMNYCPCIIIIVTSHDALALGRLRLATRQVQGYPRSLFEKTCPLRIAIQVSNSN